MPPRLEPVKKDTVKLLMKKEIHDTHIDIVGGDLIFNTSLFPLNPQIPIIIAFDKIMPPKLKSCKEMLSTNWHVLCYFKMLDQTTKQHTLLS